MEKVKLQLSEHLTKEEMAKVDNGGFDVLIEHYINNQDNTKFDELVLTIKIRSEYLR